MKLRIPPIADFQLTEEEIEEALATPINTKIRFGELKIYPEGSRPRLSNRILAYAYTMFMAEKPTEFSTLMKALFLNYVLGNIVIVKDGMRVVRDIDIQPVQSEDDEENELIIDFDAFDLDDDLPAYDFRKL